MVCLLYRGHDGFLLDTLPTVLNSSGCIFCLFHLLLSRRLCCSRDNLPSHSPHLSSHSLLWLWCSTYPRREFNTYYALSPAPSRQCCCLFCGGLQSDCKWHSIHFGDRMPHNSVTCSPTDLFHSFEWGCVTSFVIDTSALFQSSRGIYDCLSPVCGLPYPGCHCLLDTAFLPQIFVYSHQSESCCATYMIIQCSP